MQISSFIIHATAIHRCDCGVGSYQFASPIKDHVNDLFSNSVVTTSIVVGGILFPGDQLLGMEELAVHPAADFICCRPQRQGILDHGP